LSALRSEIQLPQVPSYASNNGHIFYFITRSAEDRTALIDHLKSNGVMAIFHYLPLHQSPFYRDKHDGRTLPNTERYSDRLIRLPLFYTLTLEEQQHIIDKINGFYAR